VIDDELLQELLVRATGLYNNGDYRNAITAWREALAVDPSSQKAKEGIQMATLLLADWDPAASAPTPEPPPAADGGDPRPSLREADARRIDAGVKRVRGLLLERKYSEAIEGARGLVPIDPDSEEVQRLVEEAQQAFESAPFNDEHLTLARELLEQGRRDEAEAECRKVFTLDPANPDAHGLLAEIRERPAAVEAPPEPPAGDLGGRTMRIDRSQLKAFQVSPPGETEPQDAIAAEADDVETESAETALAGESEPGAPAAAETATAAEADAIELGDLPELPEGLTAGADTPAEPELDFLPEESLDLSDGAQPAPGTEGHEGAAAPDAVELLEASLEMPPDGAGEPPAAETPAEAPAAEASEPEVIEATTVVPPSVRLVERSQEGQAAIDRLMQQLDEDEGPVESIPLAIPSPPSPAPSAAPDAAKRATPGTADAAPPQAGRPSARSAEGGWEEELESLNQKSGEHEIVGRSAARAAAPPVPPDEDLDLTALMGDELGPLQSPPAPEAPRVETPIEVHQPTVSPAASFEAEPGAAKATARERSQARAARLANIPSAADRRGGSMTSLFALGGVVILAAAAAIWWFFFLPRNALGRSQAPTAAAPPSASSGPRHDVDPGPIPTPIGSTSRQADPAAGRQNPGSEDGSNAPAPASDAPAPSGAAPASGGTAASPSPVQTPVTATAPAAAPAGPAQAPARPRTAEELRAETAQHLGAGKAFLAQEHWQDARRELAAALALDPVNFECKELLEKAQAKVNQETKVEQEYDEARRLFQDKDYQGALWKLYRLPKDPRHGNLDVAIANAWYNWAVVAVEGGDATTASQKLTEVLQVNAADADAQKMMDIASQYSSRAKDRGFYSFVDTLRFRSFDGK
jgi:tetratricopeptide (TPR) repeat protein